MGDRRTNVNVRVLQVLTVTLVVLRRGTPVPEFEELFQINTASRMFSLWHGIKKAFCVSCHSPRYKHGQRFSSLCMKKYVCKTTRYSQ